MKTDKTINIQLVLSSLKKNINHGKWTNEKIKDKDFPLFNRYPLTKRWRWKIITFDAFNRSFRILGSYNTLIPEFVSILAENTKPYNRVILRKEFHKSHAGWHVHSNCGNINNVSAGVVLSRETLRIPKANSFHRRTLLINENHVMDDSIAEALLCHNFNIPYARDDFLVKAALPWN